MIKNVVSAGINIFCEKLQVWWVTPEYHKPLVFLIVENNSWLNNQLRHFIAGHDGSL